MGALDIQINGDHYKKMKIQPIEFIIANDIGYVEGNVIKYVCRYNAKNGLEDLKKAKHYIELLIEEKEKDERDRESDPNKKEKNIKEERQYEYDPSTRKFRQLRRSPSCCGTIDETSIELRPDYIVYHSPNGFTGSSTPTTTVL